MIILIVHRSTSSTTKKLFIDQLVKKKSEDILTFYSLIHLDQWMYLF